MEISLDTHTNNYTVYNDFSLPTEKSNFFNFSAPITGAVRLSNSLQMATFNNNFLGLAAPNIGFLTRVIYIRGMESAMFNPRIVETSEEQSILEETVINMPGLIVKVKRPNHIQVRWQDAMGDTHNSPFTGLTSREIQRNIDYLDAISPLDRATPYYKKSALKKWEKNRNVQGGT